MGDCGDINVLEIYLETTLVTQCVGAQLIRKNHHNKHGTVNATMKIFNYEKVKATDVEDDGAFKVKVRWLITKDMGAKNFAMRLFEMALGGLSPLHTHSWEHEVFVLEGEGVIFDDAKATPLKLNDVVFVLSDELHQFKNVGKKALKFLCLISNPKE
jgi:quercetin dioxygenase-like cupin family protein